MKLKERIREADSKYTAAMVELMEIKITKKCCDKEINDLLVGMKETHRARMQLEAEVISLKNQLKDRDKQVLLLSKDNCDTDNTNNHETIRILNHRHNNRILELESSNASYLNKCNEQGNRIVELESELRKSTETQR